MYLCTSKGGVSRLLYKFDESRYLPRYVLLEYCSDRSTRINAIANSQSRALIRIILHRQRNIRLEKGNNNVLLQHFPHSREQIIDFYHEPPKTILEKELVQNDIPRYEH